MLTPRKALESLRAAAARFLNGNRLAARLQFGRGAGEKISAQELAGLIADLECLNGSTEQDFLAVGGKLMSFLAAAREISACMGALAEHVSGSHGEHVAGALSRILEDTRAMKARALDESEVLSGIGKASTEIRQTLAALNGVLPAFQAIGTLTRIETARLGGEAGAFSAVADEVKTLTRSVRARIETLSDASTVLSSRIALALGTLTELLARQLHELPIVTNGVIDRLEQFRECQTQAGQISRRLAAQFSAVSNVVEELVTQIQFHDITRQQIEHVIEALKQVGAESRGRFMVLTPAVSKILSLQSSQLESARDTFSASVGRIERSLADIAGHVSSMAAESRGLFGAAEQDRTGLFLQLEKSMTLILQQLRHCAEASATTARPVEDLGTRIREMQSAVAVIGDLEAQMQRMALNATIRAAHIGEPGEPLSVLANSIRELAADCGRRAELVAGTLARMVAVSHALALSPAGGESSNPGAYSDEGVKTAIYELHSSSQIAFARLKQIDELASRLSADIEQLQSQLSAGRLLAEGVDRSVGALENMAARISRTHQSGPATADLKEVDRLAGRYTMETERIVHRSAAGGAEAPVPLQAMGNDRSAGGQGGRQSCPLPSHASPAGASDPAEDLGANVELF